MTARFHREALQEFDEVALNYALHGEHLGDKFTDEVRRALAEVTESPGRWPSYRKRTRAYRLDRFPYRIVYLVRTGEVLVVTIMHTSRDPSYFFNRLGDRE